MRPARTALADAQRAETGGSLASRLKMDTARQTAKQRAREGLLAAILSGALKPGEKLLQKELAVGLGISITPVREALNELSAEGFVDLDPHRGAVVRRMSEADMVETTSILEALNPLAARLMVENITEEDLAHAGLLQARMERETDVTEFVRLNYAFHAFLTDCARAPRLSNIINPLRNSLTGMLNITVRTIEDRLSQANEEHRTLLAALAARDVEATSACMAVHMRPNRAAIRRFFEEQERHEAGGQGSVAVPG